MKKMILLMSVFVGFIFAQSTGMSTAKGESGMGLWFNHGVYQLDNDDYEGDWEVGFDYMTSMGLEVGVNMWDGAKGLELGYHHKMEKCNLNFSWSRAMWDDVDVDSDNLWFKLYCDSGLYGGLGGWSWNIGGESTDWEFDMLTFGKLWTLDMGMTVGVSYNANTEYLDMGVIEFDLGYNF